MIHREPPIKSQSIPSQWQEEPNIHWVIFGVFYIVLGIVLNLPAVSSYLFQDTEGYGALSGILFGWPLWGVTFMLRDAVQYFYENTPEKKEKSSGFWPSMIFVGLGALLNVFSANPVSMLPSVIAFVTAAFVDGIAFSRSKHHRLGYRLFYSNILAAIFDSGIYLSIMLFLGHIKPNILYHMLTAFMEVSPALIVFLLGTTVFAKVLGVLEHAVVKRVNRF